MFQELGKQSLMTGMKGATKIQNDRCRGGGGQFYPCKKKKRRVGGRKRFWPS